MSVTTVRWLKQIAVISGLIVLVIDVIAVSGSKYAVLAFGLILAGGLYPTDKD